MNLLLDLRGIQTPYFPERGIARYVANHAGALADRPEVTRLVGVLEPDRPLPAVAPRFAERDGLVSWRRVGDALRGKGPFVYHVGSPFELDWTAAQLVPPAVRRPDVLRAATLFDVIPMVYPDAHPDWLMRRWRYRAELIRSADLVLAISAFTAEDAIARLRLDERRVRVIGTGVPAVDPATLSGPRVPPAIPGLESRFVLYTGGSEHPRKNLPLLVRAFARLPEELLRTHQLVIATRVQEAVRAALQDEADRAGVGGRLLMPGYVTDEELRGLYLTCRCFVYPSRYEGFGLPPVEAMSHGAPVILSGTTSCAEVVPDPRAAFDPDDEEAVAAALRRVLEDPELAAELSARGLETAARHRWEAVAERTVAAFAEALPSRRRPPARSPRPTFAVWSYPTPGSPAGALLQAAGAASGREPVVLVSPAGLRPRRPGAVTAPPARLGRTLEWAGGPLIALVDTPEAAAAAAGPLAERGGTAVVWELDRALAAGADPLRAAVAAAARVVVGSELDAWRLRLAAGAATPPIDVVPPPLSLEPAGGRLGHELPFEARVMLDPARAAVRRARALPLLVCLRPDRFGPLTGAEVERGATLAIRLAAAGRPALVALVGDVAPEAIQDAERRCAARGAPGRLTWAPPPVYLSLLAWSGAAHAFLDLSSGAPSLSQAAVDHALLWRRPILTLSAAGPDGPGVVRREPAATPDELAAAAAGLLDLPDEGDVEVRRPVRGREPERVAERLLRIARGAPASAAA